MHYFILLLIIMAVITVIISTVIIYDLNLLNRRPLVSLYEKRKAESDFCEYDNIPEKQRYFFVLLEDEDFFDHKGYQLKAMKRALRKNIKYMAIVSGGSTITQQLMKNLYFAFSKSYLRKIAELFLAVYAEKKLGKKKILEFYLNIIYFGNGVYGIFDAAKFYFNKSVGELNANQMFLLACIPKAPTTGNPIQHPEVIEMIRNERLAAKCDFISEEDQKTILAHDASCLDEDLRKGDDFTLNYPHDIVLRNEAYGPAMDTMKPLAFLTMFLISLAI